MEYMQGNLKSNTSMDKQIPTDVAFNTVLVNVYGIRFRFSKCTSQKGRNSLHSVRKKSQCFSDEINVFNKEVVRQVT